MSPVEWYYARDNKQMGPVSSIELKRLADAGDLEPNDLVWREGMTEWSSARNVRGLFEEEGRGGAATSPDQQVSMAGDSGWRTTESETNPQDTPTVVARANANGAAPSRHLFDVLSDKCRPHFNAHFIETTAVAFRWCGSYGLFAAAALTAVFALINASQTAPIEHLLWGAIGVLVLLALQYVATKSLDAVQEIGRTTDSRLSSAFLPNCLAILSKGIGLAVLLGSVAVAVEQSQYVLILFGVAAFFVCAYLAVVALNLETLGIAIAPETLPGDEAVGVLMFLLKAILRLAPVAFGTGILYGMLLMGVACFETFNNPHEANQATLSQGDLTVVAAYHAMIASAALPLAAYLLFLLGDLLTNIWRSILSLPAKLDKLAEKGEEKKKP
jgi:hypothetical protein